eukprot:CAMPEP_0168565834 /NCGR_PEP_ID=MMETSP0413-20121227/14076_1 /TAXON_ID=136452 /ORGANISM="Filamoeba nolandi, Strain NC-AS-23-1" /LENGTH=323 /DNA_ID=CAMNT_0008597771 /DNA_START=12 /DNA_END=980 /DNA_ORIENTATION=+
MWVQTKLCDEDDSDDITADNNGNIYFTRAGDSVFRITKDKPNQEPEVLFKVKFAKLQGIAWNHKDNTLYVCNWSGSSIVSYSLDSKNIQKLFEKGSGHKDGSLEEAQIKNPRGITVDKNGDLYIAQIDYVRQISLDAKTVTTIAGAGEHQDGEGLNATLHTPFSLAVADDDTIYVAERDNHCIRHLKDGVLSTIAGTPGKEGVRDGALSKALVNSPMSIEVDIDGTVLFGDEFGLRRLNIKENRITSETKLKNAVCGLAVCSTGEIYASCDGEILQLINPWRWQRLLWIGNKKEDPKDCLLASLPTELIKTISRLIYAYPSKK